MIANVGDAFWDCLLTLTTLVFSFLYLVHHRSTGHTERQSLAIPWVVKAPLSPQQIVARPNSTSPLPLCITRRKVCPRPSPRTTSATTLPLRRLPCSQARATNYAKQKMRWNTRTQVPLRNCCSGMSLAGTTLNHVREARILISRRTQRCGSKRLCSGTKQHTTLFSTRPILIPSVIRRQ